MAYLRFIMTCILVYHAILIVHAYVSWKSFNLQANVAFFLRKSQFKPDQMNKTLV